MSDSEKDLAKLLLDLDQQELLSGWSDSGDADQKHQFFEQVWLQLPIDLGVALTLRRFKS